MSSALCGKRLPVGFAIGYINALRERLGNAMLQVIHKIPAESIVPDKMACRTWLQPLDYYIYDRTAPAEPLDYNYLSLFQQGLYLGFGTTAVENITRKVGRLWWSDEYPLSGFRNGCSLSVLFAPTLLDVLDTKKFGAAYLDVYSSKSDKERAIIGIATFAAVLKQQSGVACHVERISENKIIFTIDACPFCRFNPISCRIFWGIMDGMGSWLHSTHQPDALAPMLQLNETASTGHVLVFD